MSILLSLAFAASASAATLPSCSWDRPGRNAFVGDVVAAVDRYTDIPAPVRAALKRRMAARQYDEIATIERTAITGQFKYAPEIRDMHFGQGQVCNVVTRTKWAAGMQERGLVYCESEHCIIVPTVCRNVARVTRLSDRRAAADGRREPSQPAVSGMEVILLPNEPAAAVADASLASTSTPANASFETLAATPLATPLAPPVPGLDAAPAPGSLADRVASDAVEPSRMTAAPADLSPPTGGGGIDGPLLSIFGPVAGMPAAASPGPMPGPGFGPGEGPVAEIPEPGRAAMWLAGLAVLAFLARRRAGSARQ